MVDLVEKLRMWPASPNGEDTLDTRFICQMLAAAIEEIEKLRAALEPFANKKTCAKIIADPKLSSWALASLEERLNIIGENRKRHDAEILAARAALGKQL